MRLKAFKIEMDKKFLKNYIIGVLVGLLVLILFSDVLLDSRCHRQFGFFICFKDFVNYNIKQIWGDCYIKNYSEKGLANNLINLPVDVYLVLYNNSDLNLTNENDTVFSIFSDVNRIWNEYGINFDIRTINKYHNLSKNYILDAPLEVKNVTEEIANERLYDNVIEAVFIPKLKTKFLFWYIDSSNEGIGWRGFPNENRSIYLVIVTTNAKNITWNLAHEFGHILGSLDYSYYSGQFNLMTHSGCIKDNFYPTILDQLQVNNATSTAKSLVS